MKKNHMVLGLGLVGLSVVLHMVHYAMFHDMHHLMIFLVADIAFVPLEVFFVSLVLEKLIERQEEEKVDKKINMLVGLFYQEFGNELLAMFVAVDKTITIGDKHLLMTFFWEKQEYKLLRNKIANHSHDIDLNKIDIPKLSKMLSDHQMMITNLISNPILHEKEAFSEVLMSTFHLMDELRSRNLETLTEEDIEHLEIDFKRVYQHLSLEWVDYMEQLQKSYPYLFYTAVKNNPYDKRKLSVIESELIMSYQG